MSITLPTELWDKTLYHVKQDGIARLSIPYLDEDHVLEIKNWFKNKKNRSPKEVRDTLGRLSYEIKDGKIIITLPRRYYKMTKLQEAIVHVQF